MAILMDFGPNTSDSDDLPLPPVSRMLGLDAEDQDKTIWRDDFLTLGGRLRSIYGNHVALDEVMSAYVVSIAAGISVRITCSAEEPRAETVRVACPVAPISEADAGLWHFALRENARLQLARLSFDDGSLWADYELPFDIACGRPLQAGVTAVGKAAQSLSRELTPAFRRAA
jgi:hypothetical protein